jgi:hypothetical protein
MRWQMAKRTSRLGWWLLLTCCRLQGKSTEEARLVHKRFESLMEQISTTNPSDGLLESERHWNRMARNVAWVIAIFSSPAILLVALKGLSPWIKYPLAIIGTIPLMVVVALVFMLLANVCFRAVSGQRPPE